MWIYIKIIWNIIFQCKFCLKGGNGFELLFSILTFCISICQPSTINVTWVPLFFWMSSWTCVVRFPIMWLLNITSCAVQSIVSVHTSYSHYILINYTYKVHINTFNIYILNIELQYLTFLVTYQIISRSLLFLLIFIIMHLIHHYRTLQTINGLFQG